MMPLTRLTAVLSTLIALGPLAATSLSIDCSNIVAGKTNYNLKALEGPKTVNWQRWDPPRIHNTTFTISLCGKLAHDNKADNGSQCSDGTYICATERIYDLDSNTHLVSENTDIAGQYAYSNGKSLDANITRLNPNASSSDSQPDGLLIKLHGGKDLYDNKQMAIITLICDPSKTGTEGFETSSNSVKLSNEDERPVPTLPDLDKGKSLQFVKYNKAQGVLEVKWHTKYACADSATKPPDNGKPSGGWGFFTWVIIIMFLSVASYIIFGSWLNYNRYGARGWDLVPHGDLIRDLPYMLKDWAINLNDRIRGSGGMRGGYSAV